MTKLNCCVNSCVSNCDGCCTREGIQVVGEKATKKQETSCASYQDKSSCACNMCDCPNITLDIDCSACECMYNINCKCNAPHVDIKTSSNHSECDTFRKI